MRSCLPMGYCVVVALALLSPAASALDVQVVESNGKVLADAVVYAVPSDPALPVGPLPMAVMDQQHKAFVPHVLAIPVGTTVDFPNTDTVNHYVYTFSNIKQFQFKLFKGDPNPHRVTFDKPGVATMGCNIHDFMLGYIFVAPTRYVGVTDASGHVHLELPSKGQFSLEVWHERSNENLAALTQVLQDVEASRQVSIHFSKPLKPERRLSSDSDDY